MAVATGTPIRPELSAVDYTPFLQAAGQSAQMQAQGISALGAGVTKGFESFVQQQKENRQLEADVKSAERLATSLQPFLKEINPEAQAQFGALISGVSDPNLSLRERASNAKGIGSALNSIIQLSQLGKQTQDQKAAAEYAGMLRAGGGAIPSPISGEALSRFTPEQVAAGESAYLQQARSRAELEKTLAEAKRLGMPAPTKRVPMVDVIYDEAVSAETKRLGRELTNSERAQIAIDSIRKSQPISTPEEKEKEARLVARAQAEEKSYSDIRTSIFSSVPKYTEIMDQNRVARELIQSGETVQGPGSNVRLTIMKGINAVFPDTFDTSKSEVLAKTYKSMALTAASKMKGQGQITENERKLLADTVAALGDTPEAALFIMAFSDAVAARELARADFLTSSEKSGVRPSEGALTSDFYRDNPLTNFISDEAKSRMSGKKSENMTRVFGRLDEGVKQGSSPLRNAPKQDIDRANSILGKYKISPITFGGQPE